MLKEREYGKGGGDLELAQNEFLGDVTLKK